MAELPTPAPGARRLEYGIRDPLEEQNPQRSGVVILGFAVLGLCSHMGIHVLNFISRTAAGRGVVRLFAKRQIDVVALLFLGLAFVHIVGSIVGAVGGATLVTNESLPDIARRRGWWAIAITGIALGGWILFCCGGQL